MTTEQVPLTDVQRLAVVSEIRILAWTQQLSDKRALDEYETKLSEKLMPRREEA